MWWVAAVSMRSRTEARGRTGATAGFASAQCLAIVQHLIPARAHVHNPISRRAFLHRVAAGATASLIASGELHAQTPTVLYNGITLGNPWPPRWQYPNERPVRPPYLTNPPDVIPVDVGRQLFVDDFLIEETSLVQTCHRAEYHPGNPILTPDREWEMRDEAADRTGTMRNPAAMVFSDGVFFDSRDQLFKMWYMGGYGMSTCLATSRDGITWHKPRLDVVGGTNIVNTRYRDSSTVWLDHLDEARRFKMSLWHDGGLVLLASPDGMHWTELGKTRAVGDRSTFFYNPFRRVWVFSLRAIQSRVVQSGRYRRYWEASEFTAFKDSDPVDSVAWVKADSRDVEPSERGVTPELYNLDCVAYESVLLGLFAIWRGESSVREKINEVGVGFSRDGFYWHRPDRRAFMPVSTEPGRWNWANVQSAGGGCLIVGDKLFFYVSGRQGRPGSNAPGVCTTGLATLRRDGFVSMDWLPGEAPVLRRSRTGEGVLTTRPVRFSGSYLFVNADVRGGELRVELLDRQGRVIAPFTRDACVPITADGTRLRVRWGIETVTAAAADVVRFRFFLTRGRLYAFWVSPWASGESRGYPAAGGPEFTGATDAPAA
jgi:hypothetical protein